MPSGLLKTALTISTGMCIGIKISKCMVAVLEEYEIFVLDDEEDE